jgi:hypothetical protein
MQLATEGILETNKSARRSNLLFRRSIEQKKNNGLEWNGVDNQSLSCTDTDTRIGIGRIRIRGYGNFPKKPDTRIRLLFKK